MTGYFSPGYSLLTGALAAAVAAAAASLPRFTGCLGNVALEVHHNIIHHSMLTISI